MVKTSDKPSAPDGKLTNDLCNALLGSESIYAHDIRINQSLEEPLHYFGQLWGQVDAAVILRRGLGTFLVKPLHPMPCPKLGPTVK